jgi:hypothetical protein
MTDDLFRNAKISSLGSCSEFTREQCDGICVTSVFWQRERNGNIFPVLRDLLHILFSTRAAAFFSQATRWASKIAAALS